MRQIEEGSEVLLFITMKFPFFVLKVKCDPHHTTVLPLLLIYLINHKKLWAWYVWKKDQFSDKVTKAYDYFIFLMILLTILHQMYNAP